MCGVGCLWVTWPTPFLSVHLTAVLTGVWSVCSVCVGGGVCAFGWVCGQIRLMSVFKFKSAVAALDAHRDVPVVAEHGLRLLRNLAGLAENKVCVA
jgi:hypothetical protein